MHRTLFAAILGLVLCGAQARADGVAPPPVAGILFTVVPATWTGFYLGGTAGYGSAYIDMSVPTTFAPGPTPDGKGGVFGVLFGYTHQIGLFVGGLEVDFMAGTLEPNKSFPSLVDSTAWDITTKFDTLASLRGRAGVALGPTLLYGTAGGAWGSVQSDIAMMNGGALVARGVATADHLGWVAGGGAELALSPKWVIRAEWLHYGFDSKAYHYTGNFVTPATAPPPIPQFVGDTSVNGPSLDIVRGAIMLRF